MISTGQRGILLSSNHAMAAESGYPTVPRWIDRLDIENKIKTCLTMSYSTTLSLVSPTLTCITGNVEKSLTEWGYLKFEPFIKGCYITDK